MNPAKRYKKSLFIFRRDLRCDDNTALIHALNESDSVVACFIFDPRQVKNHPYKSEPAFNFMLESFEDLKEQLKQREGTLYYFEGKPDEIVEELIVKDGIQAVFVNEDYTPFSVTRDLSIKKVCERRHIDFRTYADALLNEPKAVTKDAGGVYTVFTPFFRKAQQLDIKKPVAQKQTNVFSGTVHTTSYSKPSRQPSGKSRMKGGRQEALSILKNLKKFKDYDAHRNIPAKGATTGLSAHHKFGTCSIRETFHAVAESLGRGHTLIDELYWRDFFSHIAYHFPHVFGECFYEEYNALAWVNDAKAFQRWCDGQTGFPIVDAGMRELNETGFMHNRARMITASFLVKDLHIDWRWGERYFACRLVDYDPCVNNGNWQWAASTGCDHQPYFRIFNPWLQQKKFDPDCRYVKQWIPELKNLDPQTIHHWHEQPGSLLTQYPAPIVDHSAQSIKAKEMFRAIKRNGEQSDGV